MKKNIIIASDLMKDKDLTQVDNESLFKQAIENVFLKFKPKKILETGTYLGEGTTRIIIESIIKANIEQFIFYSVEVDRSKAEKAFINLSKRGLNKYVKILNGLSVPKDILPTYDEIKKYTVDQIEFDNIIIDHHEFERAQKYYEETNYDNVVDDVIGKVLESFDYKLDFALLDSAGHIGFIEFKYLISKLKSPCVIALDDVNHIKHYKSLQYIKNDKRFQILYNENEKFGFAIAYFDPFKKIDDIPNIDFVNKNILWIRLDSIGDTILSIGMIKHFKEKIDNCKITVLCQEHIKIIYDNCPYVDNIITIDKDKFYKNVEYRNDFLNSYLKNNFDICINSIYSRDVLIDLLSTTDNIKYKIAFNGDLSNIKLEDKLISDQKYNYLIDLNKKNINELEKYSMFMAALGFDDYKSEPWIWLNNEVINKVENFLIYNNIDKKYLITVFPGGQYSIRDYYNFHKVIELIENKELFTFVCLGSNREYNLIEDIKKNTNAKIINLAGKTDILEASTFVYFSKLAIGTETSFSHIACATETDNVIILGGGHFGRFFPYSDLSSIVVNPLDCYNCNWICKFNEPYCITQVKPELIAEAVNDRLNGKINHLTCYYEKKNFNSDSKQIIEKYISKSIKINFLEKYYTKTQIKNISVNNYKYKCSALVSIYKSEKFIEGLMNDLISQTLYKQGGLEIVLIDSASPENEKLVIDKYLKDYPNIKYHRTLERETLYKAWNRAIELSEGEYLTSANTDDRHRDDALEILSNALDKYPNFNLVYPDLLISRIANETFDNNSATERYDFPDFNLGVALSNSIFGAQPLWRRKVHNDLGYFDENYKIGGDYEFFLRIARKYGAIHFRETLGLFYTGENNLSNSKNFDIMINETYRTLKKHRKYEYISEIYSFLKDNPYDINKIFVATWDFGCLCTLSPYPDFDLAIYCFENCNKIAANNKIQNIINKMFINNIAIISYVLGNKKKAKELLNFNKDFEISGLNLQLMEKMENDANHPLYNRKPSPRYFQLAMFDNPLINEARKTQSLYLDLNYSIKLSDITEQIFWDCYLGMDGVIISESEKNRAINKIPRLPQTQGLIKFYKENPSYYTYSKLKNLTSFSNIFWERNYINKNKVLIKAPNAIGDNLAITTVIKNLKDIYPKLSITISISDKLKTIFENNSLVDNVIEINSIDEILLSEDKENVEFIDYTNIINQLPEYYNGIGYLDIFGNIAGIKLENRNYQIFLNDKDNEFINHIKKQIKNNYNIKGLHLISDKDIKRTYPYPRDLIKEFLKNEKDIFIINFGTTPIDLKDDRFLDCAAENYTLREQILIGSLCDEFITIDSAFYHVGHNIYDKPTIMIVGPTNPFLSGNVSKGFYYIRKEELDCLDCYWRWDNNIKCMKELFPKDLYYMIKNKKYKKVSEITTYKEINYDGRVDINQFMYSLYSENIKTLKYRIIDKNKLLPVYCKNWNGVDIIYT